MKTKAMPRLAGSDFKSAVHASKPPADAPTATTGKLRRVSDLLSAALGLALRACSPSLIGYTLLSLVTNFKIQPVRLTLSSPARVRDTAAQTGDRLWLNSFAMGRFLLAATRGSGRS